MNLSVTSETGRLKGVIVHTPGNEVSLVNPEHKDELLFDDIIFEEDAKQEHIDMLQIFKAAMPADGKIFQITDLFRECLQNSEARSYFIKRFYSIFKYRYYSSRRKKFNWSGYWFRYNYRNWYIR